MAEIGEKIALWGATDIEDTMSDSQTSSTRRSRTSVTSFKQYHENQVKDAKVTYKTFQRVC